MKPHILCVDDEAANLDSIERCLRKDYNVHRALSGKEGIAALQGQKMEIIISDQRMPGMSGVEFLAEAIKMQPQAMRILQTGFADLESVIDSINKGEVYRYVTKPWDPVDFTNTVQQALDVYNLRENLKNRNDELKEANLELQSLDKLKTEFMHLISHELKTPLTAILSYSQLLAEEDMAPEHKKYLGKIDKNCGRLQQLIEDTLLITQIQLSKNTLEVSEIKISDLLQNNWNSIQEEFKKNLQFQLNSENTPFLQRTNEKMLNTILIKLLKNANQFAKPESTIKVTLFDETESWTIKIENPLQTKIEKTVNELLNPFSRDEKILNHTGGAGLGLAVSQSIVHILGGEMTISFTDSHFDVQLKFSKNN